MRTVSRLAFPARTALVLIALLVAALLTAPPAALAQKEPGMQGPFALTNAQVITAPGDTLSGATVVIQDDSIAAVGTDVTAPSGARTIDCEGLTVYPGFIDSGTRLGLQEVGSLAETQDYREIGDLTAHMEALTAVNPNSVHIPVTRVAGITAVVTAPTGGLLPGTAALIGLHGYTPEQMHLGDATPTVLDFPSVGRQGPSDDRSREAIEKEAEKALDKLNEVWDQAERYTRIDSAAALEEGRRQPAFVPPMEGLIPVIRGEQRLMISANAAADISAALDWAEERGVLDQVVLSGAMEGWRVADEIAEAGVPVVVGSIMQPPTRDSDRYDKAYRTPALLHEAGVAPIALRTGNVENVRNLVFHAGFAAAHGLDKTEALRAVTTAPAEIFGVADQVGTIEAGKRANLFVATGDPFQPATDIRHLFIDGYKLPLENRQTKLYDEFLERNPGLEK
jgi:imidazolonepropionase-like amidohydrolase